MILSDRKNPSMNQRKEVILNEKNTFGFTGVAVVASACSLY